MDRKFAWICLALFNGCAKEVPKTDLSGDEYFPPPVQGDAIRPRWVLVTRFTVKGQSEYDARVDVMVKGVYDSAGNVQCEFVSTHPRFRQDRKWSPLPMTFYSENLRPPDGLEDLNPLFQDTLDFSEKKFETEISFFSTFTRGKVFQSRWSIFAKKVIENGIDACTAYASIERSAQVQCRTDRCVIRDVIVDVDPFRYFLQQSKPVRERDDIRALTLNLENLSALGYPEGGEYSVAVPEFQ